MITAAREARASLSGSRLPVVASMQERLQRDEEASDEGYHSGLQERRERPSTVFNRRISAHSPTQGNAQPGTHFSRSAR